MRKLTGYAGARRGRGGGRHVPLPRLRAAHPRRARRPRPPDHRAGVLPGAGVPALPVQDVRAARRGRHAAGTRPVDAPTDASRGSTWAWPRCPSPASAYFFVYYDYITERFPTAHPLSRRWTSWWAPSLVAARAGGDPAHARHGPADAGLALHRLRRWSGPGCPGPLRHKGLTYEILIDQTFFTTEGLFGIPLGVAASYVILFIIFGAFLEKSGAGQFFMNLANAMAGGQRGRARQGLGGVLEPVRHHLRLGGGQRHGGRLADHSR